MSDAGPSPEHAVRSALAADPRTRPIAAAPLVPVPGGLSNHAWRADLGAQSYFVRLGGPNAANLGVDRDSECVLLATAASAGLSPRIVACDPGNGLLVADFVSGAPWRRADVHEPGNLARLGRSMRTLHSLPLPDGVREVSFESQAARLEAQLAKLETVDRSLRRIAAEAFGPLAARRAVRTLCHNDLHHLNILDDGDRAWLVDWEYGGIGDPLFDLASFLCQHESTVAERCAMIDAYDPSAAAATLVEAACRAFDYVQWLWYRLWVARGDDGTGEYGTRAAAIARRLARGPG